MGSPLSNTIAEIFLQHLEQIYLKQLLDANTIIFYTWYVDDILIVYNTKLISPETICNQINKLHPNLVFSPTHEMNNIISFLDLQITRLPTEIDTDIYRKLTITDTTINFRSNHPIQHKMAAYRYFINRMLTLPLTPANRKIEWHKILTIANNNNFPLQLIKNPKGSCNKKYKQTNQKTTTSMNGPSSHSTAQKSEKLLYSAASCWFI